MAENSSVSLSQYKSSLDDLSAEIAAANQTPAHAVDVNRDTPEAFEVQTREGTLHVSLAFVHSGLTDYLKAAPKDRDNTISGLADHVKAMRTESDSYDSAKAGEVETRTRLNRILDASEFSGVRGPTELELLRARINAWLERHLGRVFPSSIYLDFFGEILVWIVIATASSVLGVWLFRRSKEKLVERPRKPIPFHPSAKSWQAWLTEARQMADHSEWREAIRLGYWAAVSRLESDGVWRPDKARTPREYLNSIPAVNPLKSVFAAVTRTFEKAWYGVTPASASDFENFVSDLEKLGCQG